MRMLANDSFVEECGETSQVERKQQSSAWTKRETFLSSPMMGRRWLPGAAFGCKFGNGSVDHWTTHPNQSNIATAEIGCGPNNIEQHCNCRNRMFKQHRTTLGVCCYRSVGYFVGALAEVLRSEFFIFFFRCSIHLMFVYICSHTRISSTIVKRNAGKSQLDSVLNRFCPTMADHCTCNSHFPPLCMYGFHPAARLDSL